MAALLNSPCREKASLARAELLEALLATRSLASEPRQFSNSVLHLVPEYDCSS